MERLNQSHIDVYMMIWGITIIINRKGIGLNSLINRTSLLLQRVLKPKKAGSVNQKK